MVAGITLVLSQLFAESRSVNAIGWCHCGNVCALRAVIDVRRARGMALVVTIKVA